MLLRRNDETPLHGALPRARGGCHRLLVGVILLLCACGRGGKDREATKRPAARSPVGPSAPARPTGELPHGCRALTPANSNLEGWRGRDAIDGGRLVWRWLDRSDDRLDHVLMVHDLAADRSEEALRGPRAIDAPALHGEHIYFSREVVAGQAATREIFHLPIHDRREVRITDNDIPEGYPAAGTRFAVFFSAGAAADAGSTGFGFAGPTDSAVRWVGGSRGRIEFAFDGERWVVFGGPGPGPEVRYHRFDLLHPDRGAELLFDEPFEVAGIGFDRASGVAVSAVRESGSESSYRLEEWNVATGRRHALHDAAWDQVSPDVDGRLVVFIDSQALERGWWNEQSGELRIFDRVANATHVLLPPGQYFGPGIWERWVAVNAIDPAGDRIVLCDLVAAGVVDSAGGLTTGRADGIPAGNAGGSRSGGLAWNTSDDEG